MVGTPSIQVADEWDAGFTTNALEVFAKSTDLAVKVRSNEVKPVHMMLVLLCGKALNVDTLDFPVEPENPSVFWSVIEDLDASPYELAQEIKQYITRPPSRAPSSRPANDHLAPPRMMERAIERLRFKQLLPRRAPSHSREALPSPSPSGLDVETASTPVPNGAFVKAIKRAQEHKQELGDLYVAPYHLTFAIIKDTEDLEVQERLKSQHVQSATFLKALRDRKGPARVTTSEDDHFPFLSKYATDMSALARDGKLNEIVGRDEEIRRVIQILCRRAKNSAVLLGEPGVGKTAVAEGLANRIAFSQVPQSLRGTMYSLDLGALFAGAGKGEYEERVKGVIDDVMRSQQNPSPAILFIDEMHLITVGKSAGGQSSGMDAANLLKPALARGQFRCIGATTLSEYREHIEKDGALERRFAPVIVSEPTTEEAVTILRGIRERYEQHHRVWIMDQAIVTAATLAHRYLTARRLPDSAVDLMDEACASARVAQDMKPEAIDILEQDLLHEEAHIKALERDNHPDDDKALDEAREMKQALETKRKRLFLQQEAVRSWWEKIAVQRKAIQKRRLDVNRAKSEPRMSTRKILALEEDLKKLRDELVRLEHQGPGIVEDGKDLFTGGRNRHALSRTSPDIITPESIAAIVEKATKIPVQRLLATDKSRLLHLESALSQQVVGQPEAVKAVTHAIQVARTGLGNANRPIASLLFTGPSGTGKTLLSKALAHELFGQATSMVRIDGSEYSQSHSVSRLIGSPPGYVGYDQGGQLTEYVRRTPFCIVLLDEIEKTCPEFLTLFLQVLDEGRLTDGQGRLVDFRNCVIIMTSNVGADILNKVEGEISQGTRKAVMKRFSDPDIRFPLEFLNRIEEIVMFRTMSQAVMVQILDNQLRDVQQREGIKRMRLDLDRGAKEWLISKGISKEYGARPLGRVVQKELLNALSQRLLEETIHEGDTVVVRLNGAKNGLYIKPNHESPSMRQQESVPGPSSRGGRF